MIAALQMYDFPELRAETDALWAALRDALRAHGVAAPDALSRPADHHAPWDRPDLLLAQTCGWPYVSKLRGRARLVATPCYAVEGCAGPLYRSAVVVRAGEAGALAGLRGRRVAYNAPNSWSGFHALRATVAPLAERGRFFGSAVETGGHRASARAVAAGEADAAALDCVSWALIRAVEPDLAARLAVAGWTPAVPGLPLVTARGSDAATLAHLRAAVAEAFSGSATQTIRRPLGIAGAETLEDAAYDRLDALAAEADRLGYAALA
jgi:ABC-type phosphate/phosphonate transport system, periplasmic component